MDGALNPKVSLLIKIAKALDSATEGVPLDPEVVEWLDRMAELKFIRQPYMPETKDPEEENL